MISDAAVVRVKDMFKLCGPNMNAVLLKVNDYNKYKNNHFNSIFSS